MCDETKKRPAFQFYPSDWRKDVQLRSCSLAARGLWIDLMCVMHECEPYGHLVLNGRPMTAEQLVNQIGGQVGQLKRLLDELLVNGVARKRDDGAIYSKRMVDDERVRNARAAGGHAGAEHGAKGASHGQKGGRPKQQKGGSETPLAGSQEPPPSSSSSSSEDNPPASLAPPAGAGDPLVGLHDLVAEGVDPKHARDWLKVRKTKKAPLTRTAWDGVKREADSVRLSVAEAVRCAAENNWQGFRASWWLRLQKQETCGAGLSADERFAGAL